jgi:hypothetical protein
MVFGIRTTCVISAYHHQRPELLSHAWWSVLETTLCNTVCHWLHVGRWVFFSVTPVFATIKSDHHDIAELLLKMALNTRPHLSFFRITLTKIYIPYHVFLINILLTECFISYRVFIINILLTESYIPHRVFLIKIPVTKSNIPYHVFLIKIPLTKSLITWL